MTLFPILDYKGTRLPGRGVRAWADQNCEGHILTFNLIHTWTMSWLMPGLGILSGGPQPQHFPEPPKWQPLAFQRQERNKKSVCAALGSCRTHLKAVAPCSVGPALCLRPGHCGLMTTVTDEEVANRKCALPGGLPYPPPSHLPWSDSCHSELQCTHSLPSYSGSSTWSWPSIPNP